MVEGNFRLGTWLVQPSAHTISGKGKTVRLEPKVMKVLTYLADHAGEVLPKRRLIQSVWAGTYVTEDVLTRCISELRKAFEDDASAPRFIETIPKGGYRLIVPVAPETDGKEAIRSIAVIPFENADSDPDTEYLSEGITECIIGSLSELPGLRVVARTRVFRYTTGDLDPQAVGNELGVGAVLVGKVSNRGGVLTIQAELVDVADGWRLWGEQYSRKPDDLVMLQKEIACEISERLRFRLTGEERQRISRRHTDHLGAYHAYLKGRYFWNRRTEESLLKAIGYFEEAIRLDPDYALAHAGLSDGYALTACQLEQGLMPPREAYPRSEAAALRALELDDGLAEAHVALAAIRVFYEWNWTAAEKGFQRALELKPNYSTGHHWYGLYLASLGLFTEARTELRRAADLDPLSPMIHTDAGRIRYFQGRDNEAIAHYRKAIEIEPDFLHARVFLGLSFERLGRIDEAVDHWEHALQGTGGRRPPVALIGQICAAACSRTNPHKWVRMLHDLSKERYVPACSYAAVYARLGEIDTAFVWLERAFEERSGWLVYLNVDPLFDNLRHDPRFRDLAGRVGIEFRDKRRNRQLKRSGLIPCGG